MPDGISVFGSYWDRWVSSHWCGGLEGLLACGKVVCFFSTSGRCSSSLDWLSSCIPYSVTLYTTLLYGYCYAERCRTERTVSSLHSVWSMSSPIHWTFPPVKYPLNSFTSRLIHPSLTDKPEPALESILETPREAPGDLIGAGAVWRHFPGYFHC